ncbi:hypothetical protein [Dietzia sp. WMMA184]|nr:hypothetical protein [Dietzia sp. WMMA184]
MYVVVTGDVDCPTVLRRPRAGSNAKPMAPLLPAIDSRCAPQQKYITGS